MCKKKILLIDADYIAYKHKAEDILEEAIKKVDEHIAWILEFSDADGYAMFISEGKYFRFDLATKKGDFQSSYKANRGPSKQPWIKTIKEYLKSKYKAKNCYGAEADDLVVYFKNQDLRYCYHSKEHICNLEESKQYDGIKIEEVETTIVACDKDVIGNTVGKHINPNKKNEAGMWETVWIETNLREARNHFWTQMIIGDTVDGIKGIEGKGKVFAAKLFMEELSDIGERTIEDAYRTATLNAYIDKYGESKGIYEFQKNYRLLKMLETDEEWLREIGYIPVLDNVNFIEKETVNDEQLKLEF